MTPDHGLPLSEGIKPYGGKKYYGQREEYVQKSLGKNKYIKDFKKAVFLE